jgi:hypothetical protein
VLAGVLGASSNADTFGYELWGEVTLADGSTEWQALASLNLVGYAELSANLAAEATSTGVAFTGFVGTVSPSRRLRDHRQRRRKRRTSSPDHRDQRPPTRSRAASSTRSRARGRPERRSGSSPPTADRGSEPALRRRGRQLSAADADQPGLAQPLCRARADLHADRSAVAAERPANVKAYGVAFSSEAAPVDAIARPIRG